MDYRVVNASSRQPLAHNDVQHRTKLGILTQQEQQAQEEQADCSRPQAPRGQPAGGFSDWASSPTEASVITLTHF